jgi:hypothetical protein
MKTVAFWIMTLCNPVNGYQRFGGTYHLHNFYSEDGTDTFLQNFGNHLQQYAVSKPKIP